MAMFTFYRITLLALVAGLLTATGAQAQHHAALASNEVTSPPDFAQTTTSDDQPLALLSAKEEAAKLSTPPPPEASASFYDDSHKDLGPALAWMQETNAISPTYWNLYTEARIRLKMKDYQGAHATAEQAYNAALKALPASKEYVMLSADMVAKTQLLSKQ